MTSDRGRPSLLGNALTGWVALAINIVIAFWLTPFVISALGREGFGIWTVIGTVIGYYGLLNLGVESAVMRYVAKFSNQGRTRDLNETVNTASVGFLVVAVVIILFSLLAADMIRTFFNLTATSAMEFKRVLVILSFAALATLLGGLQNAILRAYERFDWANGLTVVGTSMRAVFTVAFLNAGWGLTGVAIANLLALAIRMIVQAIVCARLFPEIQLAPRYVSRRAARYLYKYGFSTFLIVIGDQLRFNLDNAVIARMVNVEAVAVFAVAAQIVRYLKQIVVTGAGVLAPRLAALDAERDQAGIVRLFLKATTATSLFTVGVSLITIVLGGRFIRFWVGDGFAEAIPVLWLLAVVHGLALCQNPTISLLYAINKHRYNAIVTVGEGIANLVLSLLLVRSYGILGVALGTALPMAVTRMIVLPVITARQIAISYRQVVGAMAIPVLSGLVVGAAFVATGFVAAPVRGTFLGLVAWGLVTLTAYSMIAALLYRVTGQSIPILDLLRRLWNARTKSGHSR